jgi:cytoskeletal protein CcmA (bactofilin family)
MGDAKIERSFFSPGSRIEGNLEIEGEVTLQGQISGKVVGTGLVTIGEQASVRANVYAPAVIVEGTLRGEIHARDRLELHRSSKVHGLIRAPRIRIDEGAFFEGECKMSSGEPRAEAKPAEPTKLDERRSPGSGQPIANKNAAQR